MKLKNWGVIQIILAVVIIVAELEIHNVYRYYSWENVFIIFNPMVLIAILMIFLGIKFIKSNQELKFHLGNLLSKMGVKNLPGRTVGIIILVTGILLFSIPVYGAGLFTTFSIARLGALFFDDAKIPVTILSLVLIVLGSKIIAESKRPQ